MLLIATGKKNIKDSMLFLIINNQKQQTTSEYFLRITEIPKFRELVITFQDQRSCTIQIKAVFLIRIQVILTMSAQEEQGDPFGKVDTADLCDNPYDKERINRVYKFPASSKEAEVHKRATKFGYNSPFMKDGSQAPICPCCQNPVNTVPIPLCYGTTPDPIKAGEQVFLLHPGTSMYFTFIKMCIYYLIMRFLVCDGYNMWTSLHGHYCKENPKLCSGDYNSYLSGYNKHTQQDAELINIVDYLNIGVTIASIIFFYYCRKYQYKVNSILEHSETSQDQFSILVEKIPLFIHEDDTTNENVKFQYEKFLKDKITEEIKKWIARVREYQSADEIKDHLDKDFYKFIVSKKKDLDKEPVVSTISLCYDLTEMETIDDQRKRLMDEYVNDQTVDVSNLQVTNLLKHLPNQIKILNDKSIELSKRFALDNTPAFNLSHFLGKAFITFHYQHYREYFLREAEKDPDFFKVLTRPIRIERPVQPKDVYWTNLKVTNEQRAATLSQSYFVLIVILLFSLAVLVGVDQIQVIFGRKSGEGPEPDFPSLDSLTSSVTDSMNNIASSATAGLDKISASAEKLTSVPDSLSTDNLSKDSLSSLKSGAADSVSNLKGQALGAVSDLKNTAMASLTSVSQTLGKFTDINYLEQQLINYLFVVLLPAITNFVNFAIKLAIDKLTELERHKTKTQKVSSFIVKNVLSRFINTAIIYYILAVLHQDIGPLTQEGFVMKVMGLVGVSALVQILTELIRPEVMYQFISNAFSSSSAEDEAKKSFQIQLNEQTQDPEFAFAEQYTFYLVQILLVSFYAVMVPAGVGILVLIFIAQYWLDKYNLFRKFSCPLDFNFFLTRLAFKAFECSLLVFAVGTFIFDMQIRVDAAPKYKLINLISVAIAGGYVYVAVLGPEWLERKVFAEEEEYYHKPYEHFVKKKVFRRTYWTENPATAFLKEKNLNNEKDLVDAPVDEKLVKEQDFDKIIALTEEDIKYETYDKADEDYFVNYDNDDYVDDVDTEAPPNRNPNEKIIQTQKPEE